MSTPPPNGDSIIMGHFPPATEEEKVQRQSAILEGRVLKLTHENTHLKAEVLQLGRSLEDISRRYSKVTADNRIAFQATQDITTRHANEMSDIFAQLQHQQHQVTLFRDQATMFQQQCNTYAAQQQHAPHVESSVYVFDKIVQTDPMEKGDATTERVNKQLSERVKDLTAREAALRHSLTQRDAEGSERSQILQQTQRSLQESASTIQKLSARSATHSVATDVGGLVQAVPLADDMVFRALSAACTLRPIQIKLYVDADPMLHAALQVQQTAFEHLEGVSNLRPYADGIYTFTSDAPAPRWDDDAAAVTPEVHARPPRRQRGNGQGGERGSSAYQGGGGGGGGGQQQAQQPEVRRYSGGKGSQRSYY